MVSQTTPAPRFFYGWIIVAACALMTMVSSGTLMAFGVFITPMAADLGWSHSTLSFTYAVSSIVSGLGILAVGSLIHAYSVRGLIFWGCLIHRVGLCLTSTVTTVGAFYLWYGSVASWLIRFGAGLISSLLAMDLLLQSERAPAAPAASVVESVRPAQTTGA